MPDRNIAPLLQQPEKIHIPEPEKIVLHNGIPLYLINQGTQEVCKIELLFAAGSLFENTTLAAAGVNELIDEGTTTKTSAGIADIFDYYGAYLQTECTADWASVSLFTLNKFLSPTLDLLMEVLTQPVFPDKELDTFKVQGKQHLTVNLEKVNYLARKHFTTALFGTHAYGYFKKQADYDALRREDLSLFHKERYLKGVKAVIVSGRMDVERQKELVGKLGAVELRNDEPDYGKMKQPPIYKREVVHIEKEDAVQNAIRIGKPVINRMHADYPRLTVVNTLLGGYFGSRLMSNIREDKGYTYGIGSGVASMQQNGYFYIATEVGAAVCKDAMKEIYREVERLQLELVPEEELALVRSYLFGSFQRSIDGPFALADRFKSVLTYGMGVEYFYRYLDVLKGITPEEVRDLAQRYLPLEGLTQVTAGKM